MPTRYTLDLDLKDIVTIDSLQSKDKKVSACKETKAKFEERFKTGKNSWLSDIVLLIYGGLPYECCSLFHWHFKLWEA
ncbi:60S ribosomal protein L27-like [Tripterygium wilfordii]|uniref:60S ribosomal protein L27-like n=1 Tax=Tripterygium wilfordii TaxID=458696 RepID=A0A7J7DKR8_TRIWF|nr:60S ribosomal protein L27-like [Tripterygium wilfordii]